MSLDDCYCDYDPPEFCRMAVRKARSEHICTECGSTIFPGERYEYTSGKWERAFSVFKVCTGCLNIRTWTQNNLPCLCWAYGHIIEDCIDAVEAVYDSVGGSTEDIVGLKFGLLRKIVERNRINKQKKLKEART